MNTRTTTAVSGYIYEYLCAYNNSNSSSSRGKASGSSNVSGSSG